MFVTIVNGIGIGIGIAIGVFLVYFVIHFLNAILPNPKGPAQLPEVKTPPPPMPEVKPPRSEE